MTNTQIAELEKEISPIVSEAQALIIKTPDQSIAAQEVLKGIKAKQKRVIEFFEPMKSQAHQAWKQVCASEGEVLKPLQAAESVLKTKVITYTQEEERRRLEAARKAEAERLEKERREREKLEAQAAKAAAEGRTEKAEALLEKAENVTVLPKVEIQPEIKAEGTAIRKVWKGEVTDLAVLIKAITEGKAPITLIQANQVAVNNFAKAMKGAVEVPGLRQWEAAEMAVRV